MATEALADAPRHVFYDRLNALLAGVGFERFVETSCETCYNEVGRSSIPPGTYFCMLLVGYLEDLSCQRGIVWRCSDSPSLRKFLSIPLMDMPDHSSLTRFSKRLRSCV